NGAVVGFFIEAADNAAAKLTNFFPVLNPTQECLIRFGESQAGNGFGTYRIWLTQGTASTWANRSHIDSTPLDLTFVYNNYRVICNGGGAFSGSDVSSPSFDSPTNLFCGYSIDIPPDDRFLGAAGVNIDFSGQDNTGQREALFWWLTERAALQFDHRRYVNLIVGGIPPSVRTMPANEYADAARVFVD